MLHSPADPGRLLIPLASVSSSMKWDDDGDDADIPTSPTCED